MRARAAKRTNGRCEVVPVMNFCGFWPSVDYVISCETPAMRRTLHRKKISK